MHVAERPSEPAAFRLAPAAKHNHHAYIGGLQEHTLSVARVCDAMAAHYGDQIDRDLLVAGALLHDIGKVKEISSHAGFPYTDEGKLLGHILLALPYVVLIVQARMVGISRTYEEAALSLGAVPATAQGGIEPAAIERTIPGQRSSTSDVPSVVFHAREPMQSRATGRFTLGAVNIDGATVFSKAELSPYFEPLLASDVDASKLSQMADRITERYRQTGYLLSYATVPTQDVQAGMVRLSIVEGRIGNIIVKGKAHLARGGRIDGNITSKTLVIEDGAIFQGQSTMDQQAAQGALLLTCYALGLGIPFIVAGLAYRRTLGVVGWVRRHQVWVMRLGGLMLVAGGALVAASRFDAQAVSAFADTIEQPVEISTIDDFSRDPANAAVLETLQASPDAALYLPVNRTRIDTYTLLRDINGEPAFVISSRSDRQFMQQATRTMLFIGIGVSLLFLLLIGFFLLFLDKSILRRLQGLADAAQLARERRRVGVHQRRQAAELGRAVEHAVEAAQLGLQARGQFGVVVGAGALQVQRVQHRLRPFGEPDQAYPDPLRGRQRQSQRQQHDAEPGWRSRHPASGRERRGRLVRPGQPFRR